MLRKQKTNSKIITKYDLIIWKYSQANTKRYTLPVIKEKEIHQIISSGTKMEHTRGEKCWKRNTSKCEYQRKWTLFKKCKISEIGPVVYLNRPRPEKKSKWYYWSVSTEGTKVTVVNSSNNRGYWWQLCSIESLLTETVLILEFKRFWVQVPVLPFNLWDLVFSLI